MAKYTVTFLELMRYRNLDINVREDRIKFANEFFTVDYNVPKQIIDELKVKFVTHYLMYEISSDTFDEFKIYFQDYMYIKKSEYEDTHALYENQGVYEYVEEKVEHDNNIDTKSDTTGNMSGTGGTTTTTDHTAKTTSESNTDRTSNTKDNAKTNADNVSDNISTNKETSIDTARLDQTLTHDTQDVLHSDRSKGGSDSTTKTGTEANKANKEATSKDNSRTTTENQSSSDVTNSGTDKVTVTYNVSDKAGGSDRITTESKTSSDTKENGSSSGSNNKTFDNYKEAHDISRGSNEIKGLGSIDGGVNGVIGAGDDLNLASSAINAVDSKVFNEKVKDNTVKSGTERNTLSDTNNKTIGVTGQDNASNVTVFGKTDTKTGTEGTETAHGLKTNTTGTENGSSVVTADTVQKENDDNTTTYNTTDKVTYDSNESEDATNSKTGTERTQAENVNDGTRNNNSTSKTTDKINSTTDTTSDTIANDKTDATVNNEDNTVSKVTLNNDQNSKTNVNSNTHLAGDLIRSGGRELKFRLTNEYINNYINVDNRFIEEASHLFLHIF